MVQPELKARFNAAVEKVFEGLDAGGVAAVIACDELIAVARELGVAAFKASLPKPGS